MGVTENPLVGLSQNPGDFEPSRPASRHGGNLDDTVGEFAGGLLGRGRAVRWAIQPAQPPAVAVHRCSRSYRTAACVDGYIRQSGGHWLSTPRSPMLSSQMSSP